MVPVKEIKNLENENLVLLATLISSTLAVLGIPFVSLLAFILIGLTTLRRGTDAVIVTLLAMAPPVIGYFMIGYEGVLQSLVTYTVPYIALLAFQSTRSWSVVSEIMSLFAVCTVALVLVIYPGVIDFFIDTFMKMLLDRTQNIDTGMSDEYMRLFAMISLGLMVFTWSLLYFLMLQFINRLYCQIYQKKWSYVGIVRMSNMYAILWLVAILVTIFSGFVELQLLTAAFAFSGIVSGGSHMHQAVRGKSRSTKSILPQVILSLYYVVMYALMPYSLLACLCVAYGYFLSDFFVNDSK